MSVPKENIWQDLRSECLGAIPSQSRVNIASPLSLALWQKHGFYTVSITTAKRFEVLASSADFGGALLTDVELLLDNAAVHQVSLWRHINLTAWLSPAWLGVTFYYWAFYLTLAITRLTGKTAWFLTKDVARDFKTMGPAFHASPGAGCYRLICGAPTTLTDRTLLLEKTNARIHDEIWRLWFGACSAKIKQFSTGSSSSLEERMFTALARSAQHLGDDWPSAFRNAINYRVGFAYTAVRRLRVLKSLGYLKKPGMYDIASLLERFEKSLVAVRSPSSIFDAPQVVLELLVDFTFIIHAIATDLHQELLDRHGLDTRWRQARQRFLRAHGLNTPDMSWPL